MSAKLQIKWRPSGGRGEYEYITAAEVEGRALHLLIPVLGSIVVTDVRFRNLDGKPRLRRDDPNDRSILNVPPLVAAMCALPLPRRSLTADVDPHTFDRDNFVVDTIDCVIRERSDDRVLLEPISLLPRGMDPSHEIDVARRLSALAALGKTSLPVKELLSHLQSGVTAASLADLASDAFDDIGPPEELMATFDSGVLAEDQTDEADPVLDYLGKEGKEKFRLHRHKERDRKLVRVAKLAFKLNYGKVFCECCGVSFEEFYGPLGAEFIEAHHRVPLSAIDEETVVSPADLAMLCANCHRMIHRGSGIDVARLKEIVLERGSVASESNLALMSDATKT